MFPSQHTLEEWIVHLYPGGCLCPGKGPSALSEDGEGWGRSCHSPWGEASVLHNVPRTASSSRPLPCCFISRSSMRVLFKVSPRSMWLWWWGEELGSPLWLRFRPAFPKQHWPVIPFGFTHSFIWGFPGGSDGKESTCNAGDPGLIPGSGRFPGEGKGYLLQYSGLENPMDRGAWWDSIHGFTKNQT